MAYCPSCGSQVSEASRFCSNCARPLNAMGTPATLQVANRDTSDPDDVPKWLGRLAVPISILTPVGVGIYSFWCYRRGRRDGLGRQPSREPYSNLWVDVAVCLVIAAIPLLGIFAAVYLATRCYKQGSRVGAKHQSAPELFTTAGDLGIALAALTSCVLIVAVGVGLALALRSDPASRYHHLRSGDCLVGSDSSWSKSDCSQAGAEVIGFWEMPDRIRPSQQTIDSYAHEHCPAHMDTFLFPSVSSWTKGDRDIICLRTGR